MIDSCMFGHDVNSIVDMTFSKSLMIHEEICDLNCHKIL